MVPIRIVLAGGFLAGYLEGGGHWTAFLQYLLGLRTLGHDAWWLELLETSGDPLRDRGRIAGFFARLAEYGVADRCVLALVPRGAPPALSSGELSPDRRPRRRARALSAGAAGAQGRLDQHREA